MVARVCLFLLICEIFSESQNRYVEMLHELLLTLSGYPGGVFVEDARTGTVKVRHSSGMLC